MKRSYSCLCQAASLLCLISLAAPFLLAAQVNSTLPDAPQPRRVMTAQTQTPQLPNASQSTATTRALQQSVTLEQALNLVKQNNPSLRATQTLILQNKAQEITANLRPNPVLQLDAQYVPLFTPNSFTDSNYWNDQAQFDAGVGYLFERGKKRQHRLDAAKTATAVTESQVSDTERTVLANAAQLFIAALLAKSNLEFAQNLLESYEKTVKIGEEQHNAGAMSQNDLLKIKLQQLQFETDLNTARLARIQALASLRQYLGFDSVPADYDVSGRLAYDPVPLKLEDLEARAFNNRPDLQAAQRGVVASESQVGLAKANGKVDPNLTFDYTRLNQNNLAAFYFSVPMAIFNRNQGEIARTQYALTQAQFQQKAAEQQVLTDVKNAYEGVRSSEQVVQLYDKGYLDQATQSLDITKFAYEHGAASLLDFLDAERSYRSTELSYRQSLATYMTALEQLRQAVGHRDLQ
ncbi:MAG TPA: TolC family protein [Candidatus Angelobacter sp.]|nr:TolC family protein [Candidatus Angelobacter sp.]